MARHCLEGRDGCAARGVLRVPRPSLVRALLGGWARSRAPGRRIGVIGTSMGGASVLLAAEPKGIWIVEGAKHQDLLRYDPKGYEEHVVEFLKDRLGD
jgi:hypothetical protein